MARVVSIHEYQLKPDADRIAFEGIVNLSGVVCCSCRWRGSSGRGTPLLAYCAAPLKPSGAGKRRPWSAKLTMRAPGDRQGVKSASLCPPIILAAP